MPGNAQSRLIVDVLGNVVLAVATDGVVRPLDLANRKSRALLAVLATHDQKSMSRERLAGMLWGAKAQAQAQGNLRNALYEIRRALTPHGLVMFINEDLDRYAVHIDHTLADIDLNRISVDLAAGQINDLLLNRERIFDGFLDDLKHVDDEFESWVVTKRTAYARRTMDRVEDLMRAASTPAHTRVLAARALSNLDPSNEEAVRLRMRALAESGDSGAALTLFVNLREYLDEHLGCEPSEPTTNLNAAIKLGDVAFANGQIALPPEPTLRLEPGTRLVIGICAFDLTGVAEASRPYALGFRTDLISSLVQFREWDIYEPKRTWDPATWPKGHNGEYAISGRATEAEGAIRLVLTLHDLETMKVIDNERIHVSRDNWFTGQDAVIRRLANWLNLNVSEERIKAFGRADKQHPPLAYDVWFKHEHGKHLLTAEQWFEAETALQNLVERYPDFGRAYASLAGLYNTKHFIFPGLHRNRDVTQRAFDYARKALLLDPKSAYGHRAIGYAHALLGQFSLAEHHFRLVMELNENDLWAQVSAAAGLAGCGHWAESQAIMKSAFASVRNPTAVMYAYSAFTLFGIGDDRAAIDCAQQAHEAVSFRMILIASMALSDQVSEARVEYSQLRSDLKRNWASNSPPSNEAVTTWLLQLWPLADDRIRLRLQDGLAKAGLAPTVDDH